MKILKIALLVCGFTLISQATYCYSVNIKNLTSYTIKVTIKAYTAGAEIITFTQNIDSNKTSTKDLVKKRISLKLKVENADASSNTPSLQKIINNPADNMNLIIKVIKGHFEIQ